MNYICYLVSCNSARKFIPVKFSYYIAYEGYILSIPFIKWSNNLDDPEEKTNGKWFFIWFFIWFFMYYISCVSIYKSNIFTVKKSFTPLQSMIKLSDKLFTSISIS